MKIDEMIAVLEAAKRGEKIEWNNQGQWVLWRPEQFNFIGYTYRIAPKKEMTLVEELRDVVDFKVSSFDCVRDTCLRAADRIEELDRPYPPTIAQSTTDELLEELKRRVK